MSKKIKSTSIFLAKLLVSGGIIFYLLKNQIDIKKLGACISNADLSWLFLGCIFFLVTAGLGVIRWNVILKTQEIFLSWVKVTRIYLVSLFFNVFMVGLTGGDFFKIYYIAKQTHKKIEAGATVFVDRIAGIVGLVGITFFASLFVLGDSRLSMVFLPVAAVFTVTFVGLFAVMHKDIFYKIGFFKKIIARLPLKEKIGRALSVYTIFKSEKKALGYILALSFLIHPLIAVGNYFVGKSIGIESVSIFYYFLLIPIICFVSALPISISGWGVGEALYVSLFGLFGVDPVKAVTLAVISRLFYIVLGLCCSLAYVLPGLEKAEEKIEEKTKGVYIPTKEKEEDFEPVA